MRNLIVTSAMAVALVAAVPGIAQTGAVVSETAPGKKTVAQTVQATATITAIDKATRDITLKGPQGNVVTVTAGPDVKNFDRLKVGDQVDLQYIEALTLQLKKGGGMPVARTEQSATASAKPGESPGGSIGREVTIVANVIAVNPAKQSVTLQGPNRTVEVVVADPEQFKLVSKGDQVQATYTQALAVAVEPSAKK